MSRVTCPACRSSLDVSKVAPGASFDCACGQKMRMPPPASGNATVLLRPDDLGDDAPSACPVCDCVERRCGTRVSNPWGWVCVAVGGVSFLLGACAPVVMLLGAAAMLVGGAMRQRVAGCAECGRVLSIGETRLGMPPRPLLAALATVGLLVAAATVLLAAFLYRSYTEQMNQYVP